jgi:hypothetical protein
LFISFSIYRFDFTVLAGILGISINFLSLLDFDYFSLLLLTIFLGNLTSGLATFVFYNKSYISSPVCLTTYADVLDCTYSN